MPSFITHFLFGEKALEMLNSRQLENVIQEHRKSFNLGTQGPDIFFYYRIWPWTSSRGVHKIGSMLHEKKVGAWFSAFLDHAKNSTGRARDILTAYLCGYVCHYCLDSRTHPYVYYRTGFMREAEPRTLKYSCYHRRFEASVDVLMLDAMHHAPPWSIKTGRLIKLDKQEAETIGKAFEACTAEAYGVDIRTHQVVTAIYDMSCAQTFLMDKTGIKRRVLGFIERKLLGMQLISSMIWPGKITDGVDYLNLSHSPWKLPWDSNSEQTDSFVEMFDEAAQEAASLCTAIYKFLEGDMEKEEILTKLGNRSFKTGLNSEQHHEFICYRCVYE